jgi:hypothetical protein
MAMTENGISTTTQLGSEKHEYFIARFGRQTKRMCQYDYRHVNGELFSTVKPTLDECRTARDKWLENQK